MRSRLVRTLRKPRLRSSNSARVSKSIFQWGVSEDNAAIYTLSILGIINGFLPKVGVVLVVNQPENTFSLKRRWW